MHGETVGEYRIEERIGQGGMGEVFRARHLRTGREVAVKFLGQLNEEDEDHKERFRREVGALSQLSHPNVIQVLDYSLDGARSYYVVPFYPKGTLKERLQEARGARKTIPVRETVRIIDGLLDGLIALHGKGYLHRDIKPANIFFDLDGHPVLGDFGLVLREGDLRLTMAHQVVGTPQYMPPEMAMSKDADARADLYQIGLVLYEMIGGAEAHRAMSARAGGAFLKELPTLLDLQPLCPPPLSEFCERSTQIDPGKRHQSAIEMKEALQQWRAKGAQTSAYKSVSSSSTSSGDLSEADTPASTFLLPALSARTGPWVAVLVIGVTLLGVAVRWYLAAGTVSLAIQPGVDHVVVEIAEGTPGPLKLFYGEGTDLTHLREVQVTPGSSSVRVGGLEPGRSYSIRLLDGGGRRSDVKKFETLAASRQAEALTFVIGKGESSLRAQFAEPMALQVTVRSGGEPASIKQAPDRAHRVELPGGLSRDVLDLSLATHDPQGNPGQSFDLVLHNPRTQPAPMSLIPVMNSLFSFVTGRNDFSVLTDAEIAKMADAGIPGVHLYCDPAYEDPYLEDYIRRFEARGIRVSLLVMQRKLPDPIDAHLDRIARWTRLTGQKEPHLIVSHQIESFGWLDTDRTSYARWMQAIEERLKKENIRPTFLAGAMFCEKPDDLMLFLDKGARQYLDGVILTVSTVIDEALPKTSARIEEYRLATKGVKDFQIWVEPRVTDKVYNVYNDCSMGTFNAFIQDDPGGRSALQATLAPFSFDNPRSPDYLPEADRLGSQIAWTLKLLGKDVPAVIWGNTHLVRKVDEEQRLFLRIAPYSYRLLQELLSPASTRFALDEAPRHFQVRKKPGGIEGIGFKGAFGTRFALWSVGQPKPVTLHTEEPVTVRSLVQFSEDDYQIRVYVPRSSEVTLLVGRDPAIVEYGGASPKSP